jgi:hypothetical protein
MQNDAPQSPTKHARAQSVTRHPIHPAVGISGFSLQPYMHNSRGAPALTAAADSSTAVAPAGVNLLLLALFREMHVKIDTLATNYKGDCRGKLEGNDEDTLSVLADFAKVLKVAITQEASALTLERFSSFILRLSSFKGNAKNRPWFGEPTATELAKRIGEIISDCEKNKVRFEDSNRQEIERAQQEERRKVVEERNQKLVFDLEARRKEEEERSRKFTAEIEAQRKTFEDELRRRSEQEEARRKEDQQRQEAAFRQLQESLEAQRKETHEAQRRAEREFERKMEQTMRDIKEKDQTIHELKRNLQKQDDEKEATIRELRQKIAGYESQRSQVAAGRTPVATSTQMPVLAPSYATLEKYLGKKHTEIFKELTKLRIFPKLQIAVEPLLKALFFEFQKPISEEFFAQLFAIKLEADNADDKSSIEALANFKTNYQKNVDTGDGDHNTHKVHLKTLYAQVTKTITTNKVPEGTTVESYIYSRLGEDIDSLLSSPIAGLSKVDLKSKAQSLRDAEIKRERPAEVKMTTPNNGH